MRSHVKARQEKSKGKGKIVSVREEQQKQRGARPHPLPGQAHDGPCADETQEESAEKPVFPQQGVRIMLPPERRAAQRQGNDEQHAPRGHGQQEPARLLQQERRERQLQRFGRKPAGQAKEQGHVERIDQTESGVGESIVRTHVLNEVAPYHAPHAKGLHPVKLLHAACGGVGRHGRSPLRRGGGPGYRRNGSLLHAVLCDPHTETARMPRARGAGGAGTGPRETGGPPRTACRAGMIKGNSVRARTGAPLFIIAYPDGYWF